MAMFNPPRELNGIPLSDRSRYLMFTPINWMFPGEMRRMLATIKEIIPEHQPLLNQTATAARMRPLWKLKRTLDSQTKSVHRQIVNRRFAP